MVLRAVSWHAILRAALPGGAPALRRRAPGHVDRGADVGDAARAPRRALARADRRAPARPPARAAARRARHARLPDAAQPARAGDPRRRDVPDRRPVRRAPERAACSTRSRRSRCCAAVLVAPALLRSGRPSRSQRVARLAASRRAPRSRACARASPSSAGRGSASSPPSTQLAAWALQWLACFVLLEAPRARRPGRRHRRGRGGAVRGQRHRGAAAHAVEPRRLPGRLRGGADERLRRRAPPTRSATGSSCRRSRSPPPSSWARPRSSRRASPGARCGCARCTRRPSRWPPGGRCTRTRTREPGRRGAPARSDRLGFPECRSRKRPSSAPSPASRSSSACRSAAFQGLTTRARVGALDAVGRHPRLPVHGRRRGGPRDHRDPPRRLQGRRRDAVAGRGPVRAAERRLPRRRRRHRDGRSGGWPRTARRHPPIAGGESIDRDEPGGGVRARGRSSRRQAARAAHRDGHRRRRSACTTSPRAWPSASRHRPARSASPRC